MRTVDELLAQAGPAYQRRYAMLGREGQSRLADICEEELDAEYDLLGATGGLRTHEVDLRVMRRCREERLGFAPWLLVWPLLKLIVPFLIERLIDHWEDR